MTPNEAAAHYASLQSAGQWREAMSFSMRFEGECENDEDASEFLALIEDAEASQAA